MHGSCNPAVLTNMQPLLQSKCTCKPFNACRFAIEDETAGIEVCAAHESIRSTDVSTQVSAKDDCGFRYDTPEIKGSTTVGRRWGKTRSIGHIARQLSAGYGFFPSRPGEPVDRGPRMA